MSRLRGAVPVGLQPLQTYERGDRTNVAIEPESITEVDEATRDAWVAETASQTRERLRAFETGDAQFVDQAREAYGKDMSTIDEVFSEFAITDDV